MIIKKMLEIAIIVIELGTGGHREQVPPFSYKLLG